VVDLAEKMDKRTEALWRSQRGAKPPWLLVGYPRISPVQGVAWAGPLSEANVKAVVDSPARRKVIQQILGGASSVWVLVESGNKARDDAAAKLIQQELKRMEGLLELPQPVEVGWVPPGAPAPPQAPALRLAFSMMRVSKKDPAERALVSMLLHTEKDLTTDYADKPIVFPIYGRGRALFALVGEGINKMNIGEACEFLAGPCTCNIRDAFTGVDMLTAVDWDAKIEATYAAAAELPPLQGLSSFAGSAGDANEEANAPSGAGDGTDEAFTVEVSSTVGKPGGQSAQPGRARRVRFRPGPLELLVLGGIGLAVLGGGAAVVVTVVVLNRRKSPPPK
jgi:hypothetical protein